MNTASAPIAATTSLSILLHGAAFAAVLLTLEQATTTGRSVDIQLISSILVSDQQETETPHNHSSVEQASLQAVANNTLEVTDNLQKKKTDQGLYSNNLLTSLNSDHLVSDSAIKDVPVEKHDVVRDVQQKKQIAEEGMNTAQVLQSTNARQQQYSILELLHSSISNNKEYPYLARRQRREGIATVGFELHPDGTIKNTRLVNSSSTAMLDRAALSAVKRIEPFTPAQDYIEQAEEFKIDVVFKLL